MKKSFILAMALMVAGCSAGLKDEVITDKTVSLNVSISQDEITKTELSDPESEATLRETLWTAGDDICVNGQVLPVPDYVIGTNKTFSIDGVAEAAEYIIVYPASAYKNGNVEITTNQVYKENNFANGSAMLIAKTDNAEKKVSLKNVCGFIKLEISRKADEEISRIVLSTNEKNPISGIFRTDFDGERPAIESFAGASAINITGISYNDEGKCEVIVAVPAGTYAEGITGKVYDNNGKFTQLNFGKGNAYEVVAGVVKKSAFTFTGSGTVSERVITDADDFALWLTDEAAACTSSNVVLLGADIDMDGNTVTPATSFAGTFDGQGFAIKNADLSSGIFAAVATTGVVKNLVIDASCVASADAKVFGTLVTVNSGSVIGCVNNANISTTAAHAAGAIAGLVGQSKGFVKNCVNNGNITVQSASITGAIYYGGVVGQITLTKVASSNVLVEGCSNSGNIAIRCTTTPKNAYVGGVVGGNTATKLADIKLVGTIQSCVNSGNIDYGFDVLDSGTYTDIGGIVGYLDGNLKDCENSGNVAYTLPIERSASATCPAAAGVAGVVIGNAENLFNRGNITINGVWAAGTEGNAGAGGYHQPIWGGVIAKHGTSYKAADDNVSADNLTNYGTISGNIYMKDGGGTIHMLGGVLGCSNGKLSHLYNNGTINVLIGGKSNYVGGIIGHHSGLVLSDCVNTAAVTVDGSDQVLTSQVVGGIVAYELIKGGALSNLENKGAITLKESNPATSTAYQYLAGIMGNYSGNTQTLNNCVNRGIITSNTTKKVRVAGVIAAIYDSTAKAPTADAESNVTGGTIGTKPLVNCHNYGNIFVNNAGNPATTNPGSIIGGIASYCSVGMEGCSNSGTITLTDCADDTVAGLMAAVINRRYAILDCTIAGKLVSNVAANSLGLFAGALYPDPTIFDLGSATKPVTVAASATINDVQPALDIDGLVGIGNAYPKEQQVVIVNVVRE